VHSLFLLLSVLTTLLTMKLTSDSGNALTDFFLQDVGITQDQFKLGQQLLSLGIDLLEVTFTLAISPITGYTSTPDP
jgi:hypothetical protein